MPANIRMWQSEQRPPPDDCYLLGFANTREARTKKETKHVATAALSLEANSFLGWTAGGYFWHLLTVAGLRRSFNLHDGLCGNLSNKKKKKETLTAMASDRIH